MLNKTYPVLNSYRHKLFGSTHLLLNNIFTEPLNVLSHTQCSAQLLYLYHVTYRRRYATHCFVFITDEDDDSGEVMMYLKTVAGDWQTVSRNLHVKADRIREFCSNHGHDSGRCLDSAVADWLSWNYNTEKYGKPTWKKVAQSVVNVKRKLFLAIASEHTVKGEQCLYISICNDQVCRLFYSRISY